jgi:hypothetical protein
MLWKTVLLGSYGCISTAKSLVQGVPQIANKYELNDDTIPNIFLTVLLHGQASCFLDSLNVKVTEIKLI